MYPLAFSLKFVDASAMTVDEQRLVPIPADAVGGAIHLVLEFSLLRTPAGELRTIPATP